MHYDNESTNFLDRAPEILLGATTYSTAVDVWSVGCIFAELILKQPLFQAKGEIEMISMIFKLLGPPGRDSWPHPFAGLKGDDPCG